MAKSIVDAVLGAEEEAKLIKSEAQKKARDILSDAQTASKELIRKANEDARIEAQKIIDDAKANAEKIINSDYRDDEYFALDSQIKSGMESAVCRIVELI